MAENSEEFLELANGCLCCSIKDAGVAAIEKLMERKGAFDHIILETTGLADPGENRHYCSSPIEPNFNLNRSYRVHVLAKRRILRGASQANIPRWCGLRSRCSLWSAGNHEHKSMESFISDLIANQQMEEDHSVDGIGESLRCARFSHEAYLC